MTNTTVGGAWIRRLHPAADSRARLLCLAHAGGSASFYHSMSASLTPEVDVLVVQYPGRQDRHAEPNLTSIAELTDGIAAAMEPWADQPLAVFGHSMGAVVGYELALRLSGTGTPIVRLFASGRRAPSRYRDEQVHRRDDAGILAELLALSGTDPSLLAEPDLRAQILASVRGDYQAIETYRHEPDRILHCPITVLAGDRDPKVTHDEARDWGVHTTAPVDLRTFPGGHFYLVEHRSAVTDLVAAQLLGSRRSVGLV
jgi:pyochelin biosynthetic protein PchC